MSNEAHNDLIAHAISAREQALAPYSKFKVGAALLTVDGRVFSGCNIESASYGLTLCAERVALVKALSEGARQFKSIAVVTSAPTLTPPCGACRQLLWEYCGNIAVVLNSTDAGQKVVSLAELFPEPFEAKSLPLDGQV